MRQQQTLLTPSSSSETSMTAAEPLPLQGMAKVYIDHILLYNLIFCFIAERSLVSVDCSKNQMDAVNQPESATVSNL